MRPFLLILLTATALLAPASRLRAADEPTREQQVQAAFVFNFMQFVEWPADAFADSKSPLVVAVVGGDGLAAAMEKALADKAIAGRSIVLKRYAMASQVEKGCHVVVLAWPERDSLKLVRERLVGTPALLVGEGESFCRDGGTIRLFNEENRVRFEINPRAAERAKLKIAAKLLKLAKIYDESD
ncbi:MAG: YfiR family protein [Tepidisphaerales bacterium]